MNNEMTQLPFNLFELNQAWFTLLSQLVVDKLALEKQIEQYEKLEKQCKELKAQLHQAQTNLLVAQGKTIIDQAKVT